MPLFVRIILAVATLLTTLAMAGLGVWAFVHGHIGMGISQTLLTLGFGFFVFHDYQFFFGKKTG